MVFPQCVPVGCLLAAMALDLEGLAVSPSSRIKSAVSFVSFFNLPVNWSWFILDTIKAVKFFVYRVGASIKAYSFVNGTSADAFIFFFAKTSRKNHPLLRSPCLQERPKRYSWGVATLDQRAPPARLLQTTFCQISRHNRIPMHFGGFQPGHMKVLRKEAPAKNRFSNPWEKPSNPGHALITRR